MSSKNNTVWFITGVSSGLGLELALYVLRAGHTVYGTVRNRERAADAVSQIEEAGGTCVILDVSDLDSIPAAIEAVIAKEGKIDILVNNAGVGLLATVEDTRLGTDRWCRYLISNVSQSRRFETANANKLLWATQDNSSSHTKHAHTQVWLHSQHFQLYRLLCYTCTWLVWCLEICFGRSVTMHPPFQALRVDWIIILQDFLKRSPGNSPVSTYPPSLFSQVFFKPALTSRHRSLNLFLGYMMVLWGTFIAEWSIALHKATQGEILVRLRKPFLKP